MWLPLNWIGNEFKPFFVFFVNICVCYFYVNTCFLQGMSVFVLKRLCYYVHATMCLCSNECYNMYLSLCVFVTMFVLQYVCYYV